MSNLRPSQENEYGNCFVFDKLRINSLTIFQFNTNFTNYALIINNFTINGLIISYYRIDILRIAQQYHKELFWNL